MDSFAVLFSVEYLRASSFKINQKNYYHIVFYYLFLDLLVKMDAKNGKYWTLIYNNTLKGYCREILDAFTTI